MRKFSKQDNGVGPANRTSLQDNVSLIIMDYPTPDHQLPRIDPRPAAVGPTLHFINKAHLQFTKVTLNINIIHYRLNIFNHRLLCILLFYFYTDHMYSPHKKVIIKSCNIIINNKILSFNANMQLHIL